MIMSTGGTRRSEPRLREEGAGIVVSSESLVVELNAVGAGEVALVGGKAAGLASLIAAGFPVPPGVCVTTAAFRLALEPFRADLAPVFSAPSPLDPSAAQDLSDVAMTALNGLIVPERVAAALRSSLFAL